MKISLRHKLFSDFSPEDLNEMLSAYGSELRSYGKDEILHHQNEDCHFMDVIVEGKVVVQNIDVNGNVLVIDSFSSGDVIGANLLFSSKGVYPMTVVASSPVLVLLMKKELILELCRKSPSFLTVLLNEISDKTIILTEKINAISRKTIRQCLLDFLAQEARKQGTNRIVMPLSKKDLAERLGIPRSSLGRELAKMRADGILEYDPWTITLL